MHDYRRFLDFDFGGTFAISEINIKNKLGSYYHYEVYLSSDGTNYKKVAFKNTDTQAEAQGDTYSLSSPVTAAYARINVSFNSSSQQVNLAEVTFFGEHISNDSPKPEAITIENFAQSSWGKEWNAAASDPSYAGQKTISELQNLVTRILGSEWSDSFIFELRDQFQGKDVFEISDAGAGKIKIRGNNGISLASGLNYYLRYWCNVDYNPFFGSQLTMPSTLPALGETILKFTDYEYRYALNFCTFSYSMAFWNWTQYEEFLDWAAMNGINLMLDIVGQEEVVRQTLKQYGYSDDEVREYLVGPAYEAWFYMQNLHSIGGPVPPSWFEQRTELARKIHDRMQTFGISPVIQGFSGQVPPDFAQKILTQWYRVRAVGPVLPAHP